MSRGQTSEVRDQPALFAASPEDIARERELRKAERTMMQLKLDALLTKATEDNPFRGREGKCHRCPSEGVRVFYCHACGDYFCIDCFKEHQP